MDLGRKFFCNFYNYKLHTFILKMKLATYQLIAIDRALKGFSRKNCQKMILQNYACAAKFTSNKYNILCYAREVSLNIMIMQNYKWIVIIIINEFVVNFALPPNPKRKTRQPSHYISAECVGKFSRRYYWRNILYLIPKDGFVKLFATSRKGLERTHKV